MKKEIVDITKINNQKTFQELGLNYAILYYIDKVLLLKNVSEINLDKLIEGRVFGETCEVKIFKEFGQLKAVIFKEEKEDEVITSKYILDKNIFKDFKYVKVKKYKEQDEDGQVYISYFRPVELI